VRDIEVDPDSIWVMAGGLSRFDRTTEKWERIFDYLYTWDIASDDRYVWMATNMGLHSYEKETGKLRRHPLSLKYDRPYEYIDSLALDGDDLWYSSGYYIYRAKKSSLFENQVKAEKKPARMKRYD